jgi:hypothetical protein
VLAHGTHDLADQVTVEAEPVLVDAARQLDPPRLRRLVGHLRLVTDPDSAAVARERRHQDRWLRLTPGLDDMVAVDGLLEPEAGAIVLAALEPLARPANANPGLVRRQPTSQPSVDRRSMEPAALAGRLQAAITQLPPPLGGAPSQPLEVGRSSRVGTAAQRAALIARDRGCVVPGCQRPPGWCEGQHL